MEQASYSLEGSDDAAPRGPYHRAQAADYGTAPLPEGDDIPAPTDSDMRQISARPSEREGSIQFALPARGQDGLGEGADPDLLLQAEDRQRSRRFMMRYTTLLCGFALAAYLAGSGHAAILEALMHAALGALAGVGGLLMWQRRRAVQ